MLLENLPSTTESTRDLLAGCLSICSQSLGIGISAINMLLSCLKGPRIDRYENILITGASSGIGKALAIKFASTGIRRLVIFGRNQVELDTTAQECREKGSEVITMVCDFSSIIDIQAFIDFVRIQNITHPFDLVIANAGMLASDVRHSDAIIDTNVKGMLATFMPILDSMKTRDNGHIVILSSINAYLGAPNQFLYSATKSFARTLGQDLSQQLRREKSKIIISVVAPGLVDTKMSSSSWEQEQASHIRSFATDANKFANKVYKGIVRGDRFITYPYYQFFASFLGGTLPPSVRDLASRAVSTSSLVGNRVT